MTTIADIYAGAEKLLNELIKKEMVDQGHHLNGAMEDSLSADVSKSGKADLMEGYAVNYTKFVNNGFPAASASMKQFPFLKSYFEKRGYPEYSSSGGLTSGALAAMTIKKWMKEGMPTQSSKSYSKTGSRTNMIENAFAGNESKIDEYLTNGYDFVIDERFHKEKNETI